MISNLRIAGPSVLVAVAGLSATATAQWAVTPIALSGRSDQYGPGMGAGVNFTNAALISSFAVINNNNQVMFRGNATGTGTPEGYWLYSGGANSNVAIAGGARPGGGNYNTGSSGIFGGGVVNDLGEWAVRNGSQTGIFMGTGPAGNRIALAGDVAPDTGAALWASSAVATGSPYYNHVGGIAFVGNFAASTTSTPPVVTSGATTNASGLYIGTSAGANMVLRQNDASTLLDAGQAAGESRVGSFQTGSMAFNSNGRYITSVNLQGANIITATGTAGQNNGAIVTNRNGSLEVIARGGALAPTATGALGTEYFRGTASTGITSAAIGFNDNGRVAFVSGLRDGGTTQTASSVLFTDTIGGVLRQVGRNGQALPTIYRPDGSVNTQLAGANWAGFTNPVINANDIVALSASGNNFASVVLTMDTTGRFTSIVTSATVAIPGGAFDGSDVNFSSFSNVQINRWGQMAFTANLSGVGVGGGPGGNNASFWVYDPTLGLHMVARTSDPFTVMAGDTRTVSGFAVTSANGGQDGRAIGLNDNGMFAFTLGFADGSSGVFTIAVPTPGAAAALGLAGIAGLRRRRR